MTVSESRTVTAHEIFNNNMVIGDFIKDAIDTNRKKREERKEEIEAKSEKLFFEGVEYAKKNRIKILNKYLESDDYKWDDVIGIGIVRKEKKANGSLVLDTLASLIWEYDIELITKSSNIYKVFIGYEGLFITFYALRSIFPVLVCDYKTNLFQFTPKDIGEECFPIFKKGKLDYDSACNRFIDYLVLESTSIYTVNELKKCTPIARKILRNTISYWEQISNSVCSSEEHKQALDILTGFQKTNKNLRTIESKELELKNKEMNAVKDENIREAGEKGENEVSYALKWLDGNYFVFDKASNDGKAIKLANLQYIKETQEYDHILVGNNGLIIIETKAYSGKIVIDEEGNWTREKKGETHGVRNPLQQVRRHEKVMKSIIPEGIEVSSIICIAKDSAVIEGVNNSVIPIVKVDQLVEYIEKNYTTARLSDQLVCECCKCIKNNMVE